MFAKYLLVAQNKAEVLKHRCWKIKIQGEKTGRWIWSPEHRSHSSSPLFLHIILHRKWVTWWKRICTTGENKSQNLAENRCTSLSQFAEPSLNPPSPPEHFVIQSERVFRFLVVSIQQCSKYLTALSILIQVKAIHSKTLLSKRLVGLHSGLLQAA